MQSFDDRDLPPELREVQERLRDARPTFTPLELDQLKLRALNGAARPAASGAGQLRGSAMRTRVLAVLVTLLVGAGTGGAIASGGAGGSSNAAKAQYKPPCDHRGDRGDEGDRGNRGGEGDRGKRGDEGDRDDGDHACRPPKDGDGDYDGSPSPGDNGHHGNNEGHGAATTASRGKSRR